MDKIGKIVSDEYLYITPRKDGFFTAEIDYKNKALIDANGRVIISGCLDIDEFSDNGIALVKKNDGSKAR